MQVSLLLFTILTINSTTTPETIDKESLYNHISIYRVVGHKRVHKMLTFTIRSHHHLKFLDQVTIK